MQVVAVVLSTLTLTFAAPSVVNRTQHAKDDYSIGESQIVGGDRVYITSFPWQVSIIRGFRLVCSGNIIDHKVVLTAAHCLAGLNIAHLRVRSGANFYYQHGRVVALTRKLLHPGYQNCDGCNNFDMALLFLEDSATALGLPAAIISLWDSHARFAPGTPATLTGWGETEPNGALARWLRGVVLPTLSYDDCAAFFSPVLANYNICAGYSAGGKDGCFGDSGSGLVISGKLAGVFAFGFGCGDRNSPKGYSSVPALRNWIRENSGV